MTSFLLGVILHLEILETINYNKVILHIGKFRKDSHKQESELCRKLRIYWKAV